MVRFVLIALLVAAPGCKDDAEEPVSIPLAQDTFDDPEPAPSASATATASASAPVAVTNRRVPLRPHPSGNGACTKAAAKAAAGTCSEAIDLLLQCRGPQLAATKAMVKNRCARAASRPEPASTAQAAVACAAAVSAAASNSCMEAKRHLHNCSGSQAASARSFVGKKCP